MRVSSWFQPGRQSRHISTAAKHGISASIVLRDALTKNAWMPPIPADA